MVHGVKVFILVGKGTNRERAELFVRKLRWIRRTIVEHTEPFMARLSMATGGHTLVTLSEFLDRPSRRWR